MTFKFRKGLSIYACIMAFILAFFGMAGIRQSGFNADIGVVILGVIFMAM